MEIEVKVKLDNVEGLKKSVEKLGATWRGDFCSYDRNISHLAFFPENSGL